MIIFSLLLRLVSLIYLIPVKIISFSQLAYAALAYKRAVLVLDTRFKPGTHVEGVSCFGKFIVLWSREKKRSPCPSWYTTTVAIKPKK